MAIQLPGLRANDPLGFLAAMGLVSLSELGALPPLRLAWTGIGAPVAAVEGPFESLESIAEALQNAFARVEDSTAVAPGLPSEFPVGVAKGQTTDPMRMSASEMRDWFERAGREEMHDDRWLARWLLSIAGQRSVKDQTRKDVVLTPFYAPTGRMSLRKALFESTAKAVCEVDGPTDALTRWRRTNFAGANYDGRATRDAAVTTSGEPDNQGAPSPTWLAVMATPLFVIADQGRHTETVGWQQVQMYPGYTRRSLVWPAWYPFLDPPAVRVMLALPELRLVPGRSGARLGRAGGRRRQRGSTVGQRLEGYGVTAVYGASRRTLSQGDGPLGPARQVWPEVAASEPTSTE